ncbi:MAG: hypothetical protein A3F16_01495 [Deltaproteobacteria bacterium RIFCSPHIGHO2_12_FULL_43_9]|nr:MAG: hypothetical protein A3F16_01495 [Deltaproteobacteria bacterium RIFCSPHIGHO2_12_FULL_43_9]
MKVYSKQHGGQNHYNEGQVFIEFICLLIIITLILICLGKPEFNFVEKFITKVEELHEKRDAAIRGIRKREPRGSYYRGNIKLSNSFNSLFPNKTM